MYLPGNYSEDHNDIILLWAFFISSSSSSHFIFFFNAQIQLNSLYLWLTRGNGNSEEIQDKIKEKKEEKIL